MRWKALVLLQTFVLLVTGTGLRAVTGSGLDAQSSDTSGTDFWLTFPKNFNGATSTLQLFMTGDKDTSGVVSVSSLSFSSPFTVTAGQVTTVTVPFGAELQTSDQVEDRGIHVTASEEVTVYALNVLPFSIDAYLGIPTALLGTDYVILAFPTQFNTGSNGSQFAVVGTEDGTTVTITPAATVGTRVQGVPYVVMLNQGQTYQLSSNTINDDLTGTLVSSNKPIAVFSGSQCADVPDVAFGFCNHLIEQLPPTPSWGKTFYTVPLATRTGGDTFRIIASADSTNVTISDGSAVPVLNRGQVFQKIITAQAQIVSDNPILVAQYSNGATFDDASADPFKILITPAEQYLGNYTVTTPSTGFSTNFVNVVAATSGVGSLKLDGAAIGTGAFSPIGATGFSGAQVPIGVGSHTLTGLVPFGTSVYGFATDDGYGYPGGYSLSPVALVNSVALTPAVSTAAVGAQTCVVAAVADQNGAGVEGVRVDFTATGAHPGTGFANTAANGQAQFCYSGSNIGTDTVVGAVGAISGNSVVVNWSDFTLSVSSDASNITAGSSIQVMVNVSPNPPTGNFSDLVTLSVSGLPDKSSATFSSNPFIPGGGQTSILTIQTTAASMLVPAIREKGGPIMLPFSLLLLTAALIGATSVFRRARTPKPLSWCVLSGVIAMLVMLAGCAGTSSVPSADVPGTPAATYTLTVTATSESLQHSSQITLTVR